MTPEHAVIARDFDPSDLRPLLDACGIDRTILVQSACTDGDTDAMFAQAAEHDWIAAVTAWVDLLSPVTAEARLGVLAGQPALRGVRHLIHEEPDPHWILRASVLESLAVVEERGLVLELPCVFPRHLGDLPELAQRFPRLTIVIDHLGKPPLGTEQMGEWADRAPRRRRAPERVREDLRAEHDARRAPAGRQPTCDPRSTWQLSASAPTGSCAAATGRSPCSTGTTPTCGTRRSPRSPRSRATPTRNAYWRTPRPVSTDSPEAPGAVPTATTGEAHGRAH